MRTVKLFALTIALLFAFGLVTTAQAEMTTIFGPVYVDGHNCRHKNVKEGEYTFTAPVPGNGVLVVKTWKNQNGPVKRDRHGRDAGLKSAKIELNDQRVLRNKEMKRKVQELNLDVELMASNDLEVKFKTCRGCEVMITVLGESQPAPAPLGINQDLPLGTPR